MSDILIATVKNYPMLYDSSHEDFRNLKLKTSIWNDIALVIGDSNGDATKARWRNLRDCYSKHLRTKTSTGMTSKNVVRYKAWPWAQEMSFLEPFMGLETQNQEHNHSDTEKNIEGPAKKSVHRAKCLKRNRDQLDMQVDKAINFLNDANATGYDPIDLIFLGYAKTIKKFSPHRQALAKYRIAKVIMETELEHVQEISQSAVDFIAFDDRNSPTEYIEPPEVKIETFDDHPANYNT